MRFGGLRRFATTDAAEEFQFGEQRPRFVDCDACETRDVAGGSCSAQWQRIDDASVQGRLSRRVRISRVARVARVARSIVPREIPSDDSSTSDIGNPQQFSQLSTVRDEGSPVLADEPMAAHGSRTRDRSGNSAECAAEFRGVPGRGDIG